MYEADIIFVYVNTKTKMCGLSVGMAIDLTYWESAACMITNVSKSNKIMVEKSIVLMKNVEAIENILIIARESTIKSYQTQISL